MAQNDNKLFINNVTIPEPNSVQTKSVNLLTTPNYVESPFIILKIGNYTFGQYNSFNSYRDSMNVQGTIKFVQYPNYMKSIDIVKINGTVNQYTIELVNQIEAGSDPNFIDKVLSSVGYGTIKISYGDWNAPSFIYKEEEALITNVSSRIDFKNSCVAYTMKCTSTALSSMGNSFNFVAAPHDVTPSDEIRDLLYNKNGKYHLLDIFPGMKNQALVNSMGWLNVDDKPVKLVQKNNIDAISYINYLVSCMSPLGTDDTQLLKSASYYMTICDDTEGRYGGTYFKITKVSADGSNVSLNTSDTYEVDIGYPGQTLVQSFNLKTDNAWALLYNYSQNITDDDYVYNIDKDGHVYTEYAPNIMRSSKYGVVTEAQKDWWTKMTQFPITGTLTIKGLLRPAMLMTYVRIHSTFYGQKHISSGLYIITRQEDRVDSSGYRTTLSLTRVSGDTDIYKIHGDSV